MFDAKKENKMSKLSALAEKDPQDLLVKAKLLPNSVPLDVDKLLKGLDIVALGVNFSDIEEMLADDVERYGNVLGAVIVENDEVSIFYRETDTENRIKFTVLHELAHCCLHYDRLKEGHVLMRYDHIFTDAEEIAANDFAAKLLMPEATLREDFATQLKFSNKGSVLETIQHLATRYKVSSNVMKERLINLSLIDNNFKSLVRENAAVAAN